MDYKPRFVQIQNPKSKLYVKIDRKLAKIVGRKKTPYYNIKLMVPATDDSFKYALNTAVDD